MQFADALCGFPAIGFHGLVVDLGAVARRGYLGGSAGRSIAARLIGPVDPLSKVVVTFFPGARATHGQQ